MILVQVVVDATLMVAPEPFSQEVLPSENPLHQAGRHPLFKLLLVETSI
jgi:hypothetical protein